MVLSSDFRAKRKLFLNSAHIPHSPVSPVLDFSHDPALVSWLHILDWSHFPVVVGVIYSVEKEKKKSRFKFDKSLIDLMKSSPLSPLSDMFARCEVYHT